MKIISSFSGGRTSAYMTIKLKEKYGDDLIVLFANTSCEHYKTLSFVNKCDYEYKLNVTWLESVVHHGKKKGCTHRITNFNNAKRDGEVFEEMIKKYGIPNMSWPHCTRELKLNPIKSWLNENVDSDYRMNIGIRFDESRRMSKQAEEKSLWYPLVEMGTTKYIVNRFFRDQPFDLDLDDYQGNCNTCFKKSDKKLLYIAQEEPGLFIFNEEMEKKYGSVGPEFKKNQESPKRVFFRKNRSAKDILKESETSLIRLRDVVQDPDLTNPCSESCEAF